MKTTRSKTRYLILGLLIEGPQSGYEIKKIVDIRFSYFWSESYGQIYPELARLAQEGLVEECPSEGESRKEKKRYQVTEKGTEALREWLQEPVEKEIVRFELLLKLFFSGQLPAQTMADHIKAFELAHKRQLELFNRFEKELIETQQPGDNHEEIRMVLLFGQKVGSAYVEWSQEVLKRLEEKSKTE